MTPEQPTVHSTDVPEPERSDIETPPCSTRVSIVEPNLDDIVDGGYGWVVVACILCMNVVTWGMNTAYGVYISYYLQHNYFEDTSYLKYSFVGGLSAGTAYASAPIVNYLTRIFGVKPPMLVGAVFVCLGQCLAGITRQFSVFIVFQGVIFGIGLGLTQNPAQPILPQWFNKRLSLAQGLATCGSGLGGLIFANTTRAALETLGVKYTLILNGCISGIVLIPCILLLKSKTAELKMRVESLRVKWIWDRKFFWVWTWGCFGGVGYFTALYSLAPYATDGLGLSQKQAAALQSIMAAGQVLGRPAIGFALDKGGRYNMAIISNIVAGLACVAIWMPARSFAALIVFAIIQGAFGGSVVCIHVPVATSAVGLIDVASAIAVFWLAVVPAAVFGQPIAVALINFSKEYLGKDGGDVYQISIGLCGGLFWLSGLMLLGGKRAMQGNWKIWKRT